MINNDIIDTALIEELKHIPASSQGVVMEQASSYGMTMANLLGEKMLLHSLIVSGVSSEFFFTVAEASPFSLNDWCHVTNIPYRTLMRYQKDNTMLKPIYTEKIFEFIEVIYMGVEVFGSSEKFERWLYKPKFIFGDKRPIDLLSSSYGKELVMTELHHIEHGIFV